ncbi:MAG: hypothetical protein GXP23_08585 [Gammaproteobacteria bacterium]|nr:hypothetical protein [Gammaproteobacteria bacterium]
MLRPIIVAVLISLSGFAMAEDETNSDTHKELARLAEKIRSGEIDVGKDYSMNEKTGRFHIIHADKLMLDCTTCHQGKAYRKDYLLVGKDKAYPARAKGQYQRSVCLGCHQKGGIARRWYNSSTEP